MNPAVALHESQSVGGGVPMVSWARTSRAIEVLGISRASLYRLKDSRRIEVAKVDGFTWWNVSAYLHRISEECAKQVSEEVVPPSGRGKRTQQG